MKKILLLIGLLCSPLCAQEGQLIINDLSSGKVDNVDSVFTPDNSVYDCRNVYFDEDFPAKKRNGMVKLNSTQIGDGEKVLSQFEYKMSDGTRYHIVHSSETVYYRLSGSTFIVLKIGVSSTYPCNYAVFMDTLTVVDGVNNMWSWDTSHTFTQNSTYQPRFIIVWQNRIWIAGDSGERSKVRCSEYLDPSDYTVPSDPADTDPAVFDINSQDGQKVMGFFLSPNGNLGILKENSVWEISGYDRFDFSLRLVMPDIGCVDSGSLAYKKGVVSWLSSEGFVGYDGYKISIISDNVSKTIDNVQQLNVGAGLMVKETLPEWNTYSSESNIEINNNPGYIQLEYPFETLETALAPVNAVMSSSGTLCVVTNDYDDMKIVCYRKSGSSETVTTIDTSATWREDTIVSPYQRKAVTIDSNDKLHVVYYKKVSGKYYVYYASAAGNGFSTTQIADTGHTLYDNEFKYMTNTVEVDSADHVHVIYSKYTADGEYELFYKYHDGSAWSSEIEFTGDNDDNYYRGVLDIDSNDELKIACEYYDGTNRKIYYIEASSANARYNSEAVRTIYSPAYSIDLELTSADVPYVIFHYQYTTFGSYKSSTTWASRFNYDMDESNALCGAVAIDSSDRVHVIFGSPNAAGNIYYKLLNPYSGYTLKVLDGNGYIARAMDIVMNTDDTPIAVYIESPLNAIQICYTTGTYISDVYDTGLTTPLFDPFSVAENEIETSGVNLTQDIFHYIRSSDTVAHIANTAWTSITNGSIPSNTGAQYLQYKCDISTTQITNNLSTIDKVMIPYHTTAGSTFLSSMYYDDRVWNAVGISSATYLDRQLIWDSVNSWTDFTSAIGCASLYNYNGTPYWGSDDGYVYTMDTGTDDDGYPIESYIETKAYSMGSMIHPKTLDSMYIVTDYSGNWNLNLDYRIDKSLTATEMFTIDLDQTDNVINYKLPMTMQLPFYTLQFKLYNNNANEPWSFMGLYTNYSEQPLP